MSGAAAAAGNVVSSAPGVRRAIACGKSSPAGSAVIATGLGAGRVAAVTGRFAGAVTALAPGDATVAGPEVEVEVGALPGLDPEGGVCPLGSGVPPVTGGGGGGGVGTMTIELWSLDAV